MLTDAEIQALVAENERMARLLKTFHCDHIRALCRACPAVEVCHEEDDFRWLDGDESFEEEEKP